MKILRLLVTQDCNRSCEGCCNKQWDLHQLPICKSYKGYNMIILTGGEPGLKPQLLKKVINQINLRVPEIPIYLYTAYPKILLNRTIIDRLDGITLTLHTKHDADIFEMLELTAKSCSVNKFNTFTNYHMNKDGKVIGIRMHDMPKSLRLNIFKGVRTPTLYHNWKVKKSIEWIKDCPLPKNEVFMRLKNI